MLPDFGSLQLAHVDQSVLTPSVPVKTSPASTSLNNPQRPSDLTPNTSQSTSQSPVNPRNIYPCFICNETGHWMDTCPNRKIYPCFICGKLDHIAKVCSDRKTYFCFLCGQPNHLAPNCPNKQSATRDRENQTEEWVSQTKSNQSNKSNLH